MHNIIYSPNTRKKEESPGQGEKNENVLPQNGIKDIQAYKWITLHICPFQKICPLLTPGTS